jgi:hypothetical protein
MKKYTPEQKKEYFANLRARWNTNKSLATADTGARAQYDAMAAESPSGTISYFSFYFTLMDMRRNGLDGLPYIDAKTYQGWKDAGFTVKKGQKSPLSGITWIMVGSNDKDGIEDEDGNGYLIPKQYALFHRSQVEPIAVDPMQKEIDEVS